MLLQNPAFFVREQVAVLRFADAYDLLHPVSGQVLGLAQEKPKLKWLRLLVKKQILPTEIVVLEADQQTVALRLEKGWSFLTSKLAIFDAAGQLPWSPGEPNNQGNEDCVQFAGFNGQHAMLNDLNCAAARAYVCEPLPW